MSEFHLGHIRTYKIDRATEVEAAVVDREVATFINLLHMLGLAQGIEEYYKPLVDPSELTREELNALPPRVRKYIEALKEKSPSYAQAKRVLRTSSKLCGGSTTGAEQDIKNWRLFSAPSKVCTVVDPLDSPRPDLL